MEALRQLLREMTENGKPETHPSLIETIRTRIQHTIQVIEPSPATKHGYNCVMYALGIVDDDDEYIECAWQCPNSVHASTDFVRYLIEHEHLSRRSQPREGTLILSTGAKRE